MVGEFTARVRGEEVAWLSSRPDFVLDDPPAMLQSLLTAARDCMADRERVRERADSLRATVKSAEGSPRDPDGGSLDAAGVSQLRKEVLARHLRATVTSALRLRQDLRALDAELDLAALLEREQGEMEVHGARLEVAVRAIGRCLSEMPLTNHALGEQLLRVLCIAEPRAATRRAAVHELAWVVATTAAGGQPAGPESTRLLRQLVRAADEDPWIRRRALLAVRGLESLIARAWLEEALVAHGGREPFLLRARAIQLVMEIREPWALAACEQTISDDSELVRSCLVDGLATRFAEGERDMAALLTTLLRADPEPRIRARVAERLRLAGAAGLPLLAPALRGHPLSAGFAADTAAVLARTGIEFPPQLTEALNQAVHHAPPGVARRAAAALHCARVIRSPAWPIAEPLEAMLPGERRKLSLPPHVSALDLADALAVFSRAGHGFSIERSRRGVVVTRGDLLTFSGWRVLHELRHPAPAKRQGHTHSVGRADLGDVRIPPEGLADESQTGVPGQRLRIDREEGWAASVPLVDDYLHATGREEIVVVTAEGFTRVRPPEGWFRRQFLRLRISLTYAAMDGLRNASIGETEPTLRSRYVKAMDALGFDTEFRGPDGPSTPYFERRTWLGPIAYPSGFSANTLDHLWVVVIAMGLALFGQAIAATARIRRAREALPLVIGGWGTRGKSGTERLKAALFEGLGLPMLSKTTGCEAMVLHAPPGGHAMELFLFRPLDKTTIWEQASVLSVANGLGARVMLWECMGLNPAYVDLLQARWMRDDLSTITNAYPDHEDIQGPTGTDVAEVIGGFAPPDALLLCTEENMLPIIAEQARLRNATIEPVDRAARELLPRDLLNRMPHAEHPANVALVAAVAGALGLNRIEAIGLMAEHVVPDLGALLLYPPCRHMSRGVVFASGMSANDTLSFKHNWRHTGYGALDHGRTPARWLVTVVNNRADRVTRSRVFAYILANDAGAHRHVLIGSNLRGFVQYFTAAVTKRAAAWELGGDPARVDSLFAHLRLVAPDALGQSCGAALGASNDAVSEWVGAVRAAETGSAIPPHLTAARARAEAARPAAAALEATCEEGGGLADFLVEALARWVCHGAVRHSEPAAIRAAYVELAVASVIVVEDEKASGDRVMATVIAAAPPGGEAWIMGMQNIKGTGLDFAYQWVWWGDLHRQLGALKDRDPDRRRAALGVVEQNPFGSAIVCEAAREALLPLVADPELGSRAVVLVNTVQERLRELLAARTGGQVTRRSSLLVRLLERLLDPFDAVLRAMRARRVFDKLVAMRISHPRAQLELRRLTERQKGGWLWS
jgi:gamma-polyglutamate synthase